MGTILRVTSNWSGFIGAPGATVMHFRDFDASGGASPEQALTATTKVHAFFDAIKPLLPQTVKIDVSTDVSVIEEANGEMQDVYSGSTTATVIGTASGAATYASAVGAVITWRTNLVRNGRRVRGRTFLVPLSSGAFQNDGTLATTTLATLNTAATNLRSNVGAGDLGVWARPTAPGANDGAWSFVTAHTVPDMGAVMRSRRD